MTQPPEDGPQQGPRFGTDPYDPSAVGGPMAEPKQFGRLKQLTLLSLAIFVVSMLLSLIPSLSGSMREQTVDTYESMGMGYSAEELQQMADIAVGVSLFGVGIGLIVGVGVYLLVYFGLAKRKNWARIVGLIFAVLGTIGMLISGVGGLTTPSAINIISSLFALAGAVVAVLWIMAAVKAPVKQYLTQSSSS
ncbi:hypothetical protein [Nesterenkonia sp. F]|uniref:hypothetical protein n=1 Tax=Nesterenkonia sp. F TaxID=795955 RepID=UPI000255D99A|nr:hypothetical protein [Nesterenkonia sp. F]